MSRSSLSAIGLVVVTIAGLGCGEKLQGTWHGEDATGTVIRLTFHNDGRLTMRDGAGNDFTDSSEGHLEYHALPEVSPMQLYLKVNDGTEIKSKMPFGIYKFENGKLVICQAIGSQRTMYGIPLGRATYEFPKEFSGDCFALERE